ncbi:MAG TPA: S-methyl-5-thioribose-1-phosphate isomerase [Candidatus Aminicenantes bacterium]|nr:S-methyl-5-thioribose-1-phosphate isomerase [Candidatus Aminicenantes bacterium]
MLPTVAWKDGSVVMIDQRRLPGEEVYLTLQGVEEVAQAIEKMAVRGAPAIGITAAYGAALGYRLLGCDDPEAWQETLRRLAATRPTAKNLFWALDRMERFYRQLGGAPYSEKLTALVREAVAIDEEDVEMNRRMGRYGASLFQDGDGILTHCNAGALATGGYGTALGVIRAALEAGKRVHVFADETRPLLQGARLTCWELLRDGIDTTLITDNMAAFLMQKGRVQRVVVGADRITSLGYVANKIGTYGVAVLAKEHGVPFYVAAPFSTFDLSLREGEEIPIEERRGDELLSLQGVATAPGEIKTWNPAFDITPPGLISALITERGLLLPPFHLSIAEAAARKG